MSVEDVRNRHRQQFTYHFTFNQALKVRFDVGSDSDVMTELKLETFSAYMAYPGLGHINHPLDMYINKDPHENFL